MSNDDNVVFPYGIKLQEEGEIDIFPVAQVSFPIRKSEWVSLFFVIDSGATISALPEADTKLFGIDVKAGEKITISGIGTQNIPGWKHLMPVRIGSIPIKLPLVFLPYEYAPRVLGRAGVFPYFTVIFEEARKRSAFVESKGGKGRDIRNILGTISDS